MVGVLKFIITYIKTFNLYLNQYDRLINLVST